MSDLIFRTKSTTAATIAADAYTHKRTLKRNNLSRFVSGDGISPPTSVNRRVEKKIAYLDSIRLWDNLILTGRESKIQHPPSPEKVQNWKYHTLEYLQLQ